MGSVSNQAITNNTYQGGYDAGWASIFSLVDFPQVYPELVQRYGAGFSAEFFEFLTIAGQTTTCKAQTITTFEEGAPERAVTLHSAITVKAAGVNISVSIDEWGEGSAGVAGQSYLTEGDKIAIPAAYITISGSKPTLPEWYQVITKGTVQASEPDTVFTCKPLNKLATLAVEVPIGTKLMVTGGNYAPGSQGAKSKTSGFYSRTFTTAIKRTRWDIEGSQQSTERYTDNIQGGNKGTFSAASVQAEFRHNHAINYELLLGGVVDNLTMNNEDSVANSVRGTLGLLPQMVSRACKQYYTSSYTIPDADMIKKAYISQGITDNTGAMFVGSEMQRGLENNSLDFIKEYSGGTDLMASLNALKVDFKVFKKNGITLTIHELKSFSNPNTLGNYDFDKFGFVVPQSKVTVKDSDMATNITLPNVVLAYKNYNGEDRTRVFSILPGVNGMSQIPGNIAISSFDKTAGEILSEFMLQAHKVNQMLLIQPDTVL